ncbi:Pentatricopeptide repeat-containing protein [Arachis hypogaea]|nr:Pentatricopeptide repeat-containing protein [Arachis hypogaea]
MLRHALQTPKLSPYSVPHSALRLCFPSTSSLHSHSHSHSQSESHDKYVDFFTRLLSRRPLPSINTFNMILWALAKRNDFPTPILLVQKLQALGIAPNLLTLNILINCFSSMGRMKLAFSVLAKIFTMGYQPYSLTRQPEAPDRAVAQWHLWKSVVAEWCAALEEEKIRRS